MEKSTKSSIRKCSIPIEQGQTELERLLEWTGTEKKRGGHTAITERKKRALRVCYKGEFEQLAL